MNNSVSGNKEISRRGRSRNAKVGMFSERQITHALAVLHHLHYEQKRSLRSLCNRIQEFARSNIDLISNKYPHIKVELTDFIMSINTFKSDIEPTRALQKYRMNAYVIWVQEFAKIEYAELLESMNVSNALSIEVKSICNLFGLDETLATYKLEMLSGNYALYRKSFVSPTDSIMIASLTIGNLGNLEKPLTYCKYVDTTKYIESDSDFKLEDKETAFLEGNIASTKKGAILVLKTLNGDPMILIVDRLNESKGLKSGLDGISGIMLPYFDENASAWSFYADKLNEPITPKTVSRENSTVKIPREFSHYEKRGFINWE